ncbi:MAG TPA: hypothetical protein VI199_13805 [Novosphingobium sp.]
MTAADAPVATAPTPSAFAIAPAERPDPMAALGAALAAGDISAARKAFADLAAQQAQGHHHHHHHRGHDHDSAPVQTAASPATPAAPGTDAPAPAADGATVDGDKGDTAAPAATAPTPAEPGTSKAA